jgi:hypothetical protein
MSNIGYIRTAPGHGPATVVETGRRPRVDSPVRAKLRAVSREIALAAAVIVVGTAIMAGLTAFRLWFLMPASFHFSG